MNTTREIRKSTAYMGTFNDWNNEDTDFVIDSVRGGRFVSIVVKGPREQFDDTSSNIVCELVNYGLMYGRDFILQNLTETS